jgi:hypothetical protein
MYSLLVTGDVPGASTYFNPLLQQTIIPCTSGTRPSSPTDGMHVFETDTDTIRAYSNGNWTVVMQLGSASYTPVLTASTTNPVLGTGAVASAKYLLWGGRMCSYWGNITAGSTFTAGSGQYFVSLPVAAGSNPSVLTPGAAMMRDNSAGTVLPGSAYLASSATTLSIVSPSGIIGSGTPWAWAASDYMNWFVTYETA